ncbi:MAG: glycosyltransferase family 4 protein [Caldimicrobium sp.]
MKNFIFFISFMSSAIASFFLVRYHGIFGTLANDPVGDGPQKFHTKPVPRVGGVAVAGGILLAGVIMTLWSKFPENEYLLLLFSAIPAFLGGLIEDLTKKIGVLTRLVFTMFSGGIGIYLLDAYLIRLDIPFFDYFLVNLPIFAYVFTVFAVGGVANAINIIDGFNGLASGVCLIIISALAYVCYEVGDSFLLLVCLSTAGAILGFMVWNFPKGLIFLGDGGAYLIGFLIAEVSVLLVKRHPEVSPWFPMLLVAYPVTETIFSIYRKIFLKGISPGVPDALHLHMLIHRRIVKKGLELIDEKKKIWLNSMTSPYLWAFTIMCALPGIFFWQNTVILIFFVIIFIIFYLWFYWRLVRFKSPKGLIKRKIE